MASPSEDELLKSAEMLHEQAKFLLEDEIAYATSLRESRRTASSLLLIVIGVGIFRFDLFRNPDHVLAVPEWAAVAIRTVFFLALLAFAYGAYLIHTERSLIHELGTPVSPSTKTGGALSILWLNQMVLLDYQNRPPLEVVRMRTDGLRLAYKRLQRANRRVRRRLALGTTVILLGLGMVLGAFGLYTLTVDLGAGGEEVHRGQVEAR